MKDASRSNLFTFTDFPATGCNFLDARLTFRRANSTGHLEICNEVGQWSVVCGSSQISVDNVRVICNQLGFDPDFVRSNNLPQSTSVLNVDRPITLILSAQISCSGNESDLIDCDILDSVPGKRQAILPVTCSSLELQCGGEYRQAVYI